MNLREDLALYREVLRRKGHGLDVGVYRDSAAVIQLLRHLRHYHLLGQPGQVEYHSSRLVEQQASRKEAEC